MKGIKDKILDWLANGETGVSSKTIAFKIAGIKLYRSPYYYCCGTHPNDPDDFKRCLKLVNIIPEIRPRLDELRSLSPEWNALVEHWGKVEKSFMSEVAEWLTQKHSQKRAPKTYRLMEKIYREARQG